VGSTRIDPSYVAIYLFDISEVGFGGIPEGRYDLGQILPAGLSREEVSQLFQETRFIGFPGHAGNLDVAANGFAFALTVVPEPTHEYGLLAALLGLVGVGRRRSNRLT